MYPENIWKDMLCGISSMSLLVSYLEGLLEVGASGTSLCPAPDSTAIRSSISAFTPLPACVGLRTYRCYIARASEAGAQPVLALDW